MKDKLIYLTKQSLKKKIKTKWFIVTNIIVGIILIGLVNIDKIITLFGGDFDNLVNIVVNSDDNTYQNFQETFEVLANSLDNSYNYKITKADKDIETLKNELEKDDDKVIVDIKTDEINYLTASIISYDELNTVSKQVITQTLDTLKTQRGLLYSGLSEEEYLSLTSPVDVQITLTNPKAFQGEDVEVIRTLATTVLILPCFFLINMLVQMIGAEINDEKSTRSMEIIISNVSPKAHFISKILSSTAFVVIEGLLLIFYAIIAVIIRNIISPGSLVDAASASEMTRIVEVIKDTGMISYLLRGLPLMIILFVFSFLAYAIVSGVLASMTTSIEDFQQLQSPLMIIMMLGYYLAMVSSAFNGSVFINILSYIPLFSFLLAPALFILGQISIIELFISTVITIIFALVMFKYGLRIYKVGILNYSSANLWKKLFKSMKKEN